MAGSVTVKELVSYLEKNFDPNLRVLVEGEAIDLSYIKVVDRNQLELRAGRDESRNTLLG